MSAYILKPDTIPKILDITELMAACYGFDIKEAMRLRLLCEEMITSVYSGIALSPGKIWFLESEGLFNVKASVNAEVYGIKKEQRQKLLKSFKPQKKSGLFKFIQDFMDEAALSDEELNFNGYMNMHYYGHFDMMNSTLPYTLNMEEIRRLSTIPVSTNEQKVYDKEQDMEINLLKGFADDIQVTSKHGTLEMTVMKKIPIDFLKNCLVNN